MPSLRSVFAVFAAGVCLLGCGANGDPTTAPPPSDPPPEGWTLVWWDEFEGSALDPSKWTPQTGNGCDLGLCGWGNAELQWYRAQNAEVRDGRLVVTARRETVNGHPYTSARLRTMGKGDWTYGRFDLRARLPRGRGVWPALWMLPTDTAYGGWAASGEIDIAELAGHEPARVHGTLHYGGEWPDHESSSASFALPSGTFADAFHTFTLEWDPNEIRWYVDGVLYHTRRQWYTTAAPYPAPFDRPFHLVVNVAVGGTFAGDPDATTVFPQTLEIDWVRVYRRSP